MKNIFAILIIFSMSYVNADGIKDDTRKIIKPFVDSFDEEAKIFNLNRSTRSISITKSREGRPTSKTMLKLRLPKKSDKYFLRFLDDDKKQNIILGIGNPFYASYQHIGFEDSKVFGGPVSSANIEVAIPAHIDAKYIVIATKDSLGNIIDIEQIEID